ncbi:FKBP-type peptidyl-prolyl cis-trans isomerase N-terminal domain-containing protein [Serratia ureilytica]|uniref:FKBP-type peptidyl-prolyl cis-trans isomerase N-terminal domain-containing protein n=1 Tax=Serratia ureilytica TaxID=300181 RepID=UPI0018E6DCB4|nr:FKBP-type peptidyl-prolyl cis-trans isomerase N-terminal domain-containing protein [Serratia ureilytica]MBJ2078372.1 FKBP-type peptidyl-prolyl cis-trans isomerase [Serratia ureilytica]
MTTGPSRYRRRLRRLATLLPLLWFTVAARAEDGVPALLQFAEEYHGQLTAPPAPTKNRGNTPAKPAPAAPKGAVSGSPALHEQLKLRDRQLHALSEQLRKQNEQLATLRQSLKLADEQQRAGQQALATQQAQARVARAADLVPLQQLIRRLREAATGTPDARRSAELIAGARQQTAQSQAALADSQARLAALQTQQQALQQQVQLEAQSRQALQKDLTTLRGQAEEKSRALTTLQHTLTERGQRDKQHDATQQAQQKAQAELTGQLETMKTAQQQWQARATEKESALTALQQAHQQQQADYAALKTQAQADAANLATQTEALQQLQARARWLAEPGKLTTPDAQQAYAAGSALGRDIVGMLDERQGWGIDTDRKTVLAGVIDAFSGHYQLPADVLTQALQASEKAVGKARETAGTARQKKDEAFLAAFKKKKGVSASPSGFWYHVGYAGDTPLPANAVVDIVVKETLTDGTVIQDMDLSGNVLSQPLEAYPPLFREAIGYLKNHGTLTMVVPPALAYGEAGYPPAVPANATMVYELRVEGSQPAPQQPATP